MKPRLGNAPRATPVAATSGANARQLGLGRVREMQPPGLASHAARSNHCGADRRTDAGSQGWKQPPGVVGAALDGLPGTTSAARQVTAHATRGASAPLVSLGPPGFRRDNRRTKVSVQTVPSDCLDQTRGVGSPALAVRRTAPAGGAKRGPPRSQGTPERARLIEPVNGQPTEPACQSRWSPRLRAGASRLTGCPPGLPGRSTAPPARTRRPGVLALWGEVASLGQSIEKLSAPSKPSRRIN